MQEIINQFITEGKPVRFIPYGSGHINETWMVETDRPHRYILQKVNTGVFPNGAGLMNNIILVTKHLRKKDPDPRHVLTLVPTKEGNWYISKGENELWRMYEFVTGGVCLDMAEKPDDFRLSGKAFGTFQMRMILSVLRAGVSHLRRIKESVITIDLLAVFKALRFSIWNTQKLIGRFIFVAQKGPQ